MTQKRQDDFEESAEKFKKLHYMLAKNRLGKLDFYPLSREKTKAIISLYEEILKAYKKQTIEDDKLKKVLDTASAVLDCDPMSAEYPQKLLALQQIGTELNAQTEEDNILGLKILGLSVVLALAACTLVILPMFVAAPPIALLAFAATVLVLAGIAQWVCISEYNSRSDSKRDLSQKVETLYSNRNAFYATLSKTTSEEPPQSKLKLE